MNKEFLTNRISSGYIRFKIKDKTLVYKFPDKNLRYIADEKYQEVYNDAISRDIFTLEELLEFYYENNIWTIEEEDELVSMPKRIEDAKVELYNCILKSNTKKIVKEKVKELKNRFFELLAKKHKEDFKSCEGLATISKNKYLVSNSIYNINFEKIEILDDLFLDNILIKLNELKIEESEYRELARSEPWRSYWNLGKDGVFGIPVIDFTEEQKTLCVWSKVYDNVYESQECPVESCIEDDDCLDGWFIAQRRKRQTEQEKNELENIVGNSKIRNSSEIFIMAETPDDARKIDNLNDPYAKMIKKQRIKELSNKGSIDEINMPDIKQEIMMQQQQLMSNKITGG